MSIFQNCGGKNDKKKLFFKILSLVYQENKMRKNYNTGRNDNIFVNIHFKY